MKKVIIATSLLVLMMAGYFIYENSKNTTYEKVLGELFKQNEKVESIKASSRVPFLKQSIKVTIDDQEMIDKILKEEIDLKKTSHYNLPSVSTFLVFQTNEDSYRIGIDENTIEVNGERYRTTPTINPIYMYLLEEKLDWELGPVE